MYSSSLSCHMTSPWIFWTSWITYWSNSLIQQTNFQRIIDFRFWSISKKLCFEESSSTLIQRSIPISIQSPLFRKKQSWSNGKKFFWEFWTENAFWMSLGFETYLSNPYLSTLWVKFLKKNTWYFQQTKNPSFPMRLFWMTLFTITSWVFSKSSCRTKNRRLWSIW